MPADLVISSLALGRASVVQGQALGFVYTIVNDGAAQSNLGYANFYIDGWDETRFRGSNVTDPLGVGASRTIFNGFNTADLSVGQHTLWIGADNFGQTAESNESNNWRAITFEVTAPPRADLVLSSLGLGSASVVQGQALGFVYTMVNDGAAQSNVGYANFYIDGFSEAHFRGSNVTDPLGVGASRTIFNGFNTADLSVGQHTLWIGADNFGQTAESNESNNWRAITFEVTAPPRADLVLSSLALGSASVSQGQALGFVYTILNDGAAQSNLGYANFYIDGFSEAHFRGSNVTDPLGVGASRTIFNGFDTADLSVGQHTLWIGADNFGQTTEGNESNNWRAINFTVTAPLLADLVVSSLALGSASVSKGQDLGFVYTIVNNGVGQSNLGYANFYIDGFSEAHFRGSNVTDPLGVGASRTIFNGFNTADLYVGQHILWIGADNFGQTTESNESNNWRAITFTVTEPLPFNISVAYSGNSAYQSYFTQAAQRWQQVITTDLPDVFSSLYGSIDDLLIHARVVPIDGVGRVLGEAGPDQFRPGAGLPYHGIMNFDSADIAAMASNGSLLSVIMHEMGHVLGLGTLWSSLGLRSGSSYVGGNAVNAYHQLGGSGSTIPLETGGGSGTALVHWSDAVFGSELMTGYISGASNPLSIMTVGSLQDMGYRVNYAAADAYSIPGHLEAGAAGGMSSDQHASALELHDHNHGDMADGTPEFVLDPLAEWTIII
jgi:subtilase family serine protease